MDCLIGTSHVYGWIVLLGFHMFMDGLSCWYFTCLWMDCLAGTSHVYGWIFNRSSVKRITVMQMTGMEENVIIQKLSVLVVTYIHSA